MPSAIAVVGRACLLPGASSPEALWDLVKNGRSAISAVPPGRFGLDPDLVRGTQKSPVDKTWSTRGGYVQDALFAGVGDFKGADDVRGLDPLFSWTLSTTHRALRDAGFDDGVPAALRGGCVLGNLSFPTEGMTRLGEALALDDEWRAATGLQVPPLADGRDRFMSGLPALLVEKHLGTRAFAFALDAACASSLYAVHLAMRALQAGRADVVVAGAVNRADSLFIHTGFCALQAMSAGGTPRPFDKAADGLVPAEGCAMLTLMRLDDAVAQKKTIHAVLRGSALSNDGRSKNLLAPSSEGQVRALRGAWRDAGLDPARASLFECHATGTQAGDRAEVESVLTLLSTSEASAPVPLGSLKSNLGHLITAAGAAGLIKVIEAMRHQQLPPTINVDSAIDVVDDRRVCLQRALAPWNVDGVRVAGVSAFGFGGNDAHVVVEEGGATGRVFASAAVKTTEVKLPRVAVCALAVRVGDSGALLAALASGNSEAKEIVVDTEGVKFPPNDLKECIAQQLLVFEAAREAVKGLSDDVLPRERTGIFIGMGTDLQVTTPGLRWRAADLARRRGVDGERADGAAFVARLRDLALPPMGAAGVLGCMPNIPANRLSVQLDVRGPGFTLSSEARSGLDALDAARSLLAAGDIDVALVGAVDACRDARHEAVVGKRGGDAAVVVVVMGEERAAALGLDVLGVIDDGAGAPAGARVLGGDDGGVDFGAAAGLLALAQGLAAVGSTIVEVTQATPLSTPLSTPTPTPTPTPKKRATTTTTKTPARRDDVAVLFGPVTSTATDPAWTRFAVVEARLRALFGSALPAMLAGKAGTAGCERDLFSASADMQARFGFLDDVAGVRAQHLVGVSLGESNAFVAAGLWRDPATLFDETIASRLFVDEVAGGKGAVKAYWAAQGKPDLGWSTVVVRAPRARIESAVAGRDDVFVTMWHADDEGEVAGGRDAVDAVVDALGGFGVPVADAPAVHAPAIAAVSARYRRLHHRATFATDLTVWSNGVGAQGGRLTTTTSDGCADAILTQASRTVDVPALLRQVHDAGVRTFLDVSPRGLLAQWTKRVLPDATVIAVDGAPVAVVKKLAEAGLVSPAHVARFWKERSEPARPLKVPAHRPPQPWPAPPQEKSTMTQKMAKPTKKLPKLTNLPPDALVNVVAPRAAPTTTTPPTTPPATTTATPPATTPATKTSPPTMTAAPKPATAPSSLPAATFTATTAPAAASSSTAEEALLAAVSAQRAALQQAHEGFLAQAQRGHAAFLQTQQSLLSSLPQLADALSADAHSADTLSADALSADALSADALSADAVVRPAPAAAAAPTPTKPRVLRASSAPAGVLYDREQLVSLASDKLSKVLGPQFARQDGFRRQVRMPRPPLLLADRVLSTTATMGKLEKSKQIVTATDVRPDAWYLHEGRVPAGVLIETGQADLLLISLMGVDFENQGERVYRLLGCDLTYTGDLPKVGDVLHHDIWIDGHATAAISASSEARIFFFHSETRLGDQNGPIVLKVRNGQAGFFTDEELKGSGGVLWKPEDENRAAIAALPHTTPSTFTTKKTLTRQELLSWSMGDAYACFGSGFEFAQTHVRTARIDPPRKGDDEFGNPDGRFIDMLLIDRVTDLDVNGGPWGRGHLRAELDLRSDKWFYDGHFQDDPCMPGTIMFQGCLQVASTWLAATGATLKRDGFRFQPRLGSEMPLRCRGQATPSSQKMVYELFVKSFVDGKEPTLRCDILVTVDGLKSLHCKDVELALVADFPVSSNLALSGIVEKRDGHDAIAPHSVTSVNAETKVTGFQSLLATGIGRPGAAFPGLYDVYDDGSAVARLPGPPYHFMSNVDDVRGSASQNGMGALFRGENPAGTRAVVRYDVPADAWYFKEAARSQGRHMPFAVLLEIALQPCGWLSSYVGSTRTSEKPLKYRNLDGKAVQHKDVPHDVGALLTTATMTKSSSSSGMIIQEFTFDVRDAGGDRVFDGSTVFGFFPDEALAVQVGVGSSDEDKARLRAPSERSWSFFDEVAPGPLVLPARRGEPNLLMLDRIEGAWRNGKGHLRVRTSKDVVTDDWFFKAHFFQDPVQPGSLGIEAMVQALQWIAVQENLGAGMQRPRFECLALGAPLVWKYRGQVVPRNKLIQVEVDVTDVVRDSSGVKVVGDGALWVDGLRTYLAKGLAIRVVDG